MDLFIKRLTDDTAVGAFLLSWNGDKYPSGESISLCIAGALHSLFLWDKDVALQTQYSHNECSEKTLWPSVMDAFLVLRGFISG